MPCTIRFEEADVVAWLDRMRLPRDVMLGIYEATLGERANAIRLQRQEPKRGDGAHGSAATIRSYVSLAGYPVGQTSSTGLEMTICELSWLYVIRIPTRALSLKLHET
jgi:hypothetical protein